ncbi:flagellar basal-body MS-ring/collar protein FliF [Rhodobacter capsulatus]|uniref:flagellar basal-body MS-ring/collar protein FliF n=1 Tax=Rhodobacter capsulatus TaxID=1061 RepID=UPI000682FFA4|nr:flagellar basal-body MS-ring/collar protein FliF [Rhodobacter capsulatus]MDS0925303.1 flagellar basal-body MS-ring/collar protein FliF [Rhodobacter capsulatus]TQD36803.1 flagellar M-ring protein FliF [Rhodobacter capsulatus]
MRRTTGQKSARWRCVLQQLMAVWQGLDTTRRVLVAGATILMFAAILALSSFASRSDMALLYAGLEGARAGEVVAALDARAVPYEVRGDSIYVDAARRDELRMALAGEGLPATGGAGYELLDGLSGFGTTSQMFDAAYWRAKEGELARTIVANPMIRAARVHIAAPSGQSFRKENHPTASVTVTTASGGLSPTHAKALKFLVSSAVQGMSPDDVSIIDSVAGLISTGDDVFNPAANDRAEELRSNVERLLEARVGYGNAVVEVSVQTVTEREAITEKRIEPDSRVAISTETQERSEKSDDTKPGAVTVASNLPQGDAANGGKSQSQASETREQVNFEVSETTREVLRNPGDIKRLTVAVLVDGVEGKDANGVTAITPRTDEELAALKELVASAVGFDEKRGDVITIRSMAFEPLAETGTEATSSLFASAPLDTMQLIKIAVLAIVALILGLFVMRPILAQRAAAAEAERAMNLPGGMIGSDEGTGRALTGEIADGDMPIGSMNVVSDFDIGDMPMTMGTGNFGDMGMGGESGQASDPVARLKKLIEERQAESVEILRSWMDEAEERA